MVKFSKNKNSEVFLFFVTMCILNIPKLDLIKIPGITQGIRIDDILIFLVVLLNLRYITLDKKELIIIFYITFIYLFSFIHQADSIHTNYVHAHYLKVLEYFFLYLVLSNKLNQKLIYKIAICTLIFQFSLVLLFALSNEFAGLGRTSRASGTTAGPWELSMMLGELYFIIYDYFKKLGLNFFSFISYLTIWLVIIYTKSRIVAISIIGVFIFKQWKRLILFFPVLIIIYVFYQNIGQSIVEFNSGLKYFQLQTSLNFLRDYGDIIIKNWMSGDFYLGEGGRYFDESTLIYDPSLVGRLQQWGRYLEIMFKSDLKIFAILFGSGPGSGGVINDGMYIKILVDFGFIGLISYLIFIIKTFIKKKEVRLLLIFISISCITLDFYWPTKIAYSCILALCYFGKKNFEVKVKNKQDTLLKK